MSLYQLIIEKGTVFYKNKISVPNDELSNDLYSLTGEILEKNQVRKNGKQKREFRDYIQKIASEEGYDYKEEKSFGACNVVIGNIDTAKAVYTAHYDTCAVLPFPNFITPKNFFIYLIYQFIIAFGFLGILYGLAYLLIGLPSMLIENEVILSYINDL